MNPLPNYPGSKGGAGVAERLVSLMPPHRVYVEAFLGGGALLRLKAAAGLSIGIDADPAVIRAWRPRATPGLTLAAALAGGDDSAGRIAGNGERVPARRILTPKATMAPGHAIVSNGVASDRLCIAHADVLKLLASSSPAVLQDPATLVYADPPYLASVRGRMRYACEMADVPRHKRLLRLLRRLPCMVMVSHYPCPLYDELLSDWRRIQYRCQTRGGTRIEACWCNFPAPAILHDARFTGGGFRERERIKRKSARWQARFLAMGPGERQVVASALAMVDREVVEASLRHGHEDRPRHLPPGQGVRSQAPSAQQAADRVQGVHRLRLAQALG